MYTNDNYFYSFLNLDNKNIGVYHLNRPLPNGEIIKLGEKESLKDIIKYHERDAVILISHEANFSLSLIEDLHENVFGFDCIGNISHKRYCAYFYWFGLMRIIEKTGPALPNLLDYTKKTPEYHFDCLLGNERSHRDFVYNRINSSKFKKLSLTSYFGKTKSWIPGGHIDTDPHLKGAVNSFDQPSLSIDINDLTCSQFWVPYNHYNTTCMMSQLLPWRIYNNSWYSIITESLLEKDIHSEKTAKALLGGRIFVLFSGCGALHSLRQAGFQTFGDIIDESYDNIEDNDLRVAMAWQQVEALAQTNPYNIYKKFDHIIQHNRQHLLNTDWDNQFRQNVYKFLTA